MPEITSLRQHLFSFVKARLEEPAWSSGAVAEQFVKWLRERRNSTLSAEMREVLKTFVVLEGAAMEEDFKAFLSHNLPVESETPAAFALRYQRDAIDRGRLLTTGAHNTIVTHLKILNSGEGAMRAFAEWHYPQFRKLLGEFRAWLFAEGRVCVPTGLAVYKIAESLGYGQAYNDWVLSRAADVRAERSDLWLPKADDQAACWNWALTALEGAGPKPEDVFG